MIKTDKMESVDGSIVQPQARFPPPRYLGDLPLKYLNHRVDLNLLNHLQLTFDDQVKNALYMFGHLNRGWNITHYGPYDVDVNLNPRVYFTHPGRLLQEITTFYL